jgi:lipopolysaccharide export system protein LptA
MVLSAVVITVALTVLSAVTAAAAEPSAAPSARTTSRTDSGGANAPADAGATAASDAQKSGNRSASKSERDSTSPFGAFATSANRGPVNIQSDSLSLDYKNNSVLFRGHVRASQADGELTCNTLEVKYGKDFHEVQQMICNDDVRISQGVRWCTGDRGVLNQTVHTVVLTGNPVCHDTNDQIAGNRITMHLDSGRSEVEGAKAVIFPRPSKTRDNEASVDHVK